jgi:hypothetical protein
LLVSKDESEHSISALPTSKEVPSESKHSKVGPTTTKLKPKRAIATEHPTMTKLKPKRAINAEHPTMTKLKPKRAIIAEPFSLCPPLPVLPPYSHTNSRSWACSVDKSQIVRC